MYKMESVAEITEYRGRKRIGMGVVVTMMHSLKGQGRTEELLEVGLAKVLALEGSVLAQSELAIAVGAPINLLAIFPPRFHNLRLSRVTRDNIDHSSRNQRLTRGRGGRSNERVCSWLD